MTTPNQQLWESVHASRAWGKYPPEDVVRFVANRFGSIPKEARRAIRMLDVGCGQGAVSWFLAREGFAVTAIDVSSSAIEKARAYLALDGLDAEFAVADFGALPFPSGSFDCVFDVESVYTNTTADIKKIYADLRALVKPGGSFFAMAFSTECSNFGTGTKVEEHTYTDIPGGSPSTGLAHYFDRQEIEDCVTGAGFTSVEINQKTVTRKNGSERVAEWIVYGNA